MNSKVVSIDAYKENKLPHKVSEVICVKCGFRWIAVRSGLIRLKELECKNCGSGFVIETGESIINIDEIDEIKHL